MNKFYILAFFAFLNASQEIVLSKNTVINDTMVERCKKEQPVVVDIGDYDRIQLNFLIM